MKTIKTLHKDGVTLTHFRYVDSFGFLQDYFELTKLLSMGELVLYPFLPRLKIKTSMSTVDDFTADEYEQMLLDAPL